MILQGFNWFSHESGTHLKILRSELPRMKRMGIKKLWIPPCVRSHKDHPQGYYPVDYLDFNSSYGTSEDLSKLLASSRPLGIDCLYDLICWSSFGDYVREPFKFGEFEVSPDDPGFVDRMIKYTHDIMDLGFGGVRLDYLKSWPCNEVGYGLGRDVESVWMMGELWDTMDYDHSWLCADQDRHRRQIKNYMDLAGGGMHMLDFTTKGILQTALSNREYWRLGGVPGLIGIDPSRSITFLDNHDTNWSDQNHWPFSGQNKDAYMVGYMYIMTHPGTPCVYWNHYTDWYDDLVRLSDIRSKISPRTVDVLEASDKRYTAIINGNWEINIGESIQPRGTVSFQWSDGTLSEISS